VLHVTAAVLHRIFGKVVERAGLRLREGDYKADGVSAKSVVRFVRECPDSDILTHVCESRLSCASTRQTTLAARRLTMKSFV